MAVIAWLLFAALTAAVAWSAPSAFDTTLSARLFTVSQSFEVVAAVCRGLDWLAGYVVSLVAVGVTAMWLLLSGRRFLAGYLLASALGGLILSDAIKAWTDRPRPVTVGQVLMETTTSYPSGHSTASVSVWLALAAVFVIVLPRPWRWWVGGALAGFTVLIGLSRLVAGVHWPTDVLGGWLLGLAWSSTVGAVTLALARRYDTKAGAGMRESGDATEPKRSSPVAQDS